MDFPIAKISFLLEIYKGRLCVGGGGLTVTRPQRSPRARVRGKISGMSCTQPIRPLYGNRIFPSGGCRRSLEKPVKTLHFRDHKKSEDLRKPLEFQHSSTTSEARGNRAMRSPTFRGAKRTGDHSPVLALVSIVNLATVPGVDDVDHKFAVVHGIEDPIGADPKPE